MKIFVCVYSIFQIFIKNSSSKKLFPYCDRKMMETGKRPVIILWSAVCTKTHHQEEPVCCIASSTTGLNIDMGDSAVLPTFGTHIQLKPMTEHCSAKHSSETKQPAAHKRSGGASHRR